MKSKIFIGIGAFALAVGGFFVSKANKKFAAATRIYVKGLNVVLANPITSSHLTTVKGVGAVTCFFATVSGTLHTIFTSSSQTKQIYYK